MSGAPANAGTRRLADVTFWTLMAGAALATVLAFKAESGLAEPLRITAAVLLAVALVIMFRKPELGPLALVALAPLTDYGALTGEPLVITAFSAVLIASVGAYAWGLRRAEAKAAARSPLEPLELALLGPLLAALWSLPFSLNLPKTALQSGRLLLLWLFAVLVARLVATENALRRLLALFVGVGCALSVMAAVQYTAPDSGFGNVNIVQAGGGAIAMVRPAVFYKDPNFLAGYLGAAALVALAFALRASTLRAASLWGLAAAATVGGLALTFSRSGWVGLVCGLLVVTFTAPAPRRAAFAIGLALVLAAGVLAAPQRVLDRVTSLSDLESDASITTRYLMLGATVEIIRDHWAFGTGLGAYDVAYPKYRRAGALERITRPHQLPLAMWAEMGLAGLAAEIALLGGLAVAFARRRRTGMTAADMALAAALTALLVETLFQYYLYFEVLWLFVALAAAAPRRTAQDGPGTVSGVTSRPRPPTPAAAAARAGMTEP